MEGLAQIVTTVSTRDEALALAHEAVDAGAAACVQILGPITSVYRWEGHVQEQSEFLLLAKAPGERSEALAAFLAERHPFDTPEVAVYEAGWVDPRYLAWAAEVTAVQESEPPSAKQ
ncbi:MAG: divalent-cation tolerance protein CutA [Actinomycetota bacterium]